MSPRPTIPTPPSTFLPCKSLVRSLRALQRHDAIGLGPAPVVAEAHAEDAAHRAEHRESQIARLEIALLQMLEGPRRLVLGMARQEIGRAQVCTPVTNAQLVCRLPLDEKEIAELPN